MLLLIGEKGRGNKLDASEESRTEEGIKKKKKRKTIPDSLKLHVGPCNEMTLTSPGKRLSPFLSSLFMKGTRVADWGWRLERGMQGVGRGRSNLPFLLFYWEGAAPQMNELICTS